MEEATDNQSLKMRYLRRSTINIPGIDMEVNLASKPDFEDQARRTSHEQRSQSVLDHPENQKLVSKIFDLKTKLQQEKLKNLEYQKDIEILRKEVEANKAIVLKHKNQISELKEKLEKLKQTESELVSTNNQLKDTKEELLHFQNISKQEQDEKVGLESKLKEATNELKKLQLENYEYKEKISDLTKSSAELEKQLEIFLSEETAKTNKVQKELEFGIEKFNNEKEELRNTFDAFKLDSEAFLLNLNARRETILRSVEENKVTVNDQEAIPDWYC